MVHQIAQPDFAKGGRPRNPKAFRLLEELQTNTKIYYLSSKEWVRKAIHKPDLLDHKTAEH